MSILAMLEGMGLSDLQDFEIHAFGRHGPVKEGKMPVVVRKSHCQFHLCHTFSLAQKILELSLSNCLPILPRLVHKASRVFYRTRRFVSRLNIQLLQGGPKVVNSMERSTAMISLPGLAVYSPSNYFFSVVRLVIQGSTPVGRHQKVYSRKSSTGFSEAPRSACAPVDKDAFTPPPTGDWLIRV